MGTSGGNGQGPGRGAAGTSGSGGAGLLGGGGGGYSGGGGDGDDTFSGGDGGSYIDPSFTDTSIAITETGDGFVNITPDFVATPEPGSALLLGSVFISSVSPRTVPKSAYTLI